MKHPNAATAGGSIAPSVLIVWLAGYFGVDMSAEVGAVLAGVVASALLLIGRQGVRGILRVIWRGAE